MPPLRHRGGGAFRSAVINAGALYESGKSGTVLDLRLIGGEGIVAVETMALADWDKTDFLF